MLPRTEKIINGILCYSYGLNPANKWHKYTIEELSNRVVNQKIVIEELEKEYKKYRNA